MPQQYNRPPYGNYNRKPPDLGGTFRRLRWKDWGWIVFFFAIGVWPVAFILLFTSLDRVSKEQRREENARPQQVYVRSAPAADAQQAQREAEVRAEAARQAAAKQQAARQQAAQQPQGNGTGARRQQPLEGLLSSVMVAIGALLGVLALTTPLAVLDISFSLGSLGAALMLLMMFGAGSGFLLWKGMRMKKCRRLLRRYTNVLGKRTVMALDDIAAILNIPADRVAQELDMLLDDGLLPGGYIDYARRLLVLDADALEHDPAYAAACEAQQQARAAQKAQQSPQGRSSLLAEIRAVNDRIENPVVTEQIHRIEAITGQILGEVTRDPAKEAKVSTFMSYYLPTTLKILNAYEHFEAQDVKGDNIENTMRGIEKILTNLVVGFERQLDLLYESESMDISADIDVLEGMLAKDGLSDDFLTMPKPGAY